MRVNNGLSLTCFGNLRSCFQLGTHTLSVPVSLHATNRKRLCDCLKKAKGMPSGAVVLLQGGEQKQQYCSDRDILFRQVIISVDRLAILVD